MKDNKILKFKTKSDDVVDFLEEAKNHAVTHGIDNVMILMKLKGEDSHVLAGYCNLNVFEKQELMSHIQVDIMRDYIEANYID